jgi:succinate dehydrogenase / fumarate reductase membrane anchor subunit
MVKRIVTGAHYGLRDWVMQRVTAVVMAVYTPLFLFALCCEMPLTYESWRSLFAQGWMRFATFLFLVSVFLHAWVGIRDILMDYIKPAGIRFTLEMLVILALVGYGGWAVQTLWRL